MSGKRGAASPANVSIVVAPSSSAKRRMRTKSVPRPGAYDGVRCCTSRMYDSPRALTTTFRTRAGCRAAVDH